MVDTAQLFSTERVDSPKESSASVSETNSVNKKCTTGGYEDVEFVESALGEVILFTDVAIGKGKFGVVFEAMLNDEYVAVKISTPFGEANWRKETNIYSMSELRHPSILNFIGSDVVSDRLLLVTEYHPKGSMYDYLRMNTINVQMLLHYTLCIGCGLHHLHNEIQGKPAIAHRDLKTQNILLKLDGSCCIADFGFALTEEELSNTPNLCYKVGTRRYMAPEIFGKSVNTDSFKSFLKIDIYALSLVYWELCRRTVSSDNEVDNFDLPYQDSVPDPNEEDMREALFVQKVRPLMSPRWQDEHIINEIMKVAEKCWEHNPDDRPSMPQIGELLSVLARQVYLPYHHLRATKTKL